MNLKKKPARKKRSRIKLVLFTALILLLGFVGSSLLFSDLGPGETPFSRLLVTIVFYLISGIIIGYLVPKLWPLAVFVAWGAIFLGVGDLLRKAAEEPPVTSQDAFSLLMFLLPPVASALAGGFLGSLLGERHIVGRFFHTRKK